jgi:hypothetical protein
MSNQCSVHLTAVSVLTCTTHCCALCFKQSYTYGVNVTANGTYGVNYYIARTGFPDGDLPLKVHMIASGNCSDTDNRVGIVDIADFNGPGGKDLRVGGGDVDLTTDIKQLTVCYEKANFIQVDSYVFGDAGSGTPTKAPTSSPTAGELTKQRKHQPQYQFDVMIWHIKLTVQQKCGSSGCVVVITLTTHTAAASD